MEPTPLPCPEAYPLASASIPYWRNWSVLENGWNSTKEQQTEDFGSDAYLEFLFWRQVAVIWACATIEAFINDEGAAWVGADWYKKTIERARIDEKVLLIYALKYGMKLPLDHPAIKKVNQLFQLRGQLVHPKAKSGKVASNLQRYTAL
jgi:hypothetical protein